MSLRNAMFAFALCGLGIGSALAQNAAPAPQAARPAQGLDRLLDQIREGSQQMSKTNQEREARFLRDKNQQAQLLAVAVGARNAADARAKQAKARF